MTDFSEIVALPQSWSRDEVMAAFDISDKKLDALIKGGRVGYIVARNRKRRFMAEHIGQIREALEVKAAPEVQPEDYALIGVTRRAARRRSA
jgi:hypothetical protein